MKKIIDRTKSKRPIIVPDEEDIKKLEQARERAIKELHELESSIMALEEDKQYHQLVEESKRDMIEIALAVMDLPAGDSIAISRAQGQFHERKRLTQKLARMQNECEHKKTFVNTLTEQVRCLIGKVFKMKEGIKDGRTDS